MLLLGVMCAARADHRSLVAGLTNADKLPIDYTSYAIYLAAASSALRGLAGPASVSRDLRFKVHPARTSRGP